MKLPIDLSNRCENILTQLSFVLVESDDFGMSKNYLWQNEMMNLRIINDRGFYELYVTSQKKPIKRLVLIKLLRIIKNDTLFYNSELIEANLLYTLPINKYIELLYENYDIIKEYLLDFDQKKFDSYENYQNIF